MQNIIPKKKKENGIAQKKMKKQKKTLRKDHECVPPHSTHATKRKTSKCDGRKRGMKTAVDSMHMLKCWLRQTGNMYVRMLQVHCVVAFAEYSTGLHSCAGCTDKPRLVVMRYNRSALFVVLLQTRSQNPKVKWIMRSEHSGSSTFCAACPKLQLCLMKRTCKFAAEEHIKLACVIFGYNFRRELHLGTSIKCSQQ